ncbi:MAG: hypothetical protein DRP71_14295 [Verrucomicrobia bacterium]|nr:MAG: hypothetical protein DRP71_14295 [Verrucomicrobiota bacterium]
MKTAIQIQVLLTTLALAGPSVAQLEILVPAKQVSTVLPRIYVVGRTGESRVAISLNGDHVTTAAVVDSIFHALIWMPYGLNQITVATVPEDSTMAQSSANSLGFSGSKQVAELEVLCGPRISREYQKMFASSIFHNTIPHPECLGCHSLAAETGAASQDAEWCYRCHPIIREQFRGHGADDEQLCINCHRLSADLTKRKTGVYTDMNPCFLCHKDKIGEFAQDFIHGPVAGGTCTVCHNPHGSQFANNLRSPVPVLCLFCHTSIDQMDDPVQHKPFADGHCADCHDAHATGNRWVLTRDSGELCLGCHEDVVADGNHRHPVGNKPKTRLKRDMALNDEGRMECLTCHHPHSGEAEYLLRTSGGHACLGCHPEYQ